MASAADLEGFVKVILIGDSGVGKSCMLMRFCEGTFLDKCPTTVGLDFRRRTVVLDDGQTVKLHMWDTAGGERFRALTSAFYRNASAIVVAFDLTDEKSFCNVRTWMRNIEQHARPDAVKLLVGNKIDLDAARCVSTERIRDLAEQFDLKFVEVSAKTGQNLERAFVQLAADVVARNGNSSDPSKSVGLKPPADPAEEDTAPSCCR